MINKKIQVLSESMNVCETFSLVNKKQESWKPHTPERNRKNACFVQI